jgi:hypothetical protein
MMTSWNRPLAVLLCAGGLAALGDQPLAYFASFNDWLGAEAKGIRVGADGRLRLAPNLRKVGQLSDGVVWCAIPDGSGGIYLSAGTEGRLFHFLNGQMKPLTQVKGGIVFAMARMGPDLIVAPTGEGKLYRVNPAGDIKPFADIEAKLAWAIQVQGNEVVVAGGGEKGAVLVLAREGSSRKLVELPDETSFTAMLPDGQGGYFLGTHGRGQVVRYTGMLGGDRLENLVATGFEEVRALALQDGVIYAGVNNGLATRFSSGALERREAYLAEPAPTAKCAVVRVDRQGVPETLWQSSQAQVFTLATWNGQLLVGTGNRSRIFGIPLADRERALDPFCALQDLGTAQATAFLPLGNDLVVVASNPAELHILSQAQATEGTLDGKVLKGNPIADWGRAYLDVEQPVGTKVELQFRVGNTETPDTSWTPWTPPLLSGERPNLRMARFAQFRLRLSSTRGGATPVVEGLRVHWANRNLPPMWENVEVMPPGVVITRQAPPDDIGIERVPFETQKLIPAMAYGGAEKRSFRRGAQAFVFKVADANGDQLSYRIRLLPETGAPIELEKAWKEKFFTFDTLPVPDGRYRLEVVATDAPSQAFNAALASTWRTAPFWVDHTPPVISELTATTEGENLRIRFTAKDATSPLKEAAVSADGDGWLQIVPEDRVFDNLEEHFEVLIPKDRIRGDRVMVRVVDLHNNEQAAAVTLDEVLKRKR